MGKGKSKINNQKNLDSEDLNQVAEGENNLAIFFKGKEQYIALLLIALVAFFVFKDFLLFKKVMLYKDVGLDSLNASFPFLLHASDYIHSVGFPSWSFNYGMGESLFPFILRDPFDVLLYLFGKNNIAFAIGYVEFFKVILAGFIFFHYLKTIEMKGFTSLVGALLFSFTGFMMIGVCRYVFSSEAVMLVFLLLAFEKLYKQDSWFLFPIAVAVLGIAMPFYLYLFGMFIIIYACLRYFEDTEKVEFKKIMILLSKMFLYGLLGVAISSFFLFENISQLIDSPRGSGEDSLFNNLYHSPVFKTNDFSHNVTAILRLFSSDMLGSGPNYKGWWDYLESPDFYSGLLCLIVLPQSFYFFNKRQKIIFSSFLLLWILPVVFPYFRYAFWLFASDYYRTFSLFTSFAIIFISLKGLNYIISTNKINIPVLIGTIIVLVAILFFPYFKKANTAIDHKVMNVVKIILLLYVFLIYLLRKRETSRIAGISLLVVMCFELGYLSYLTVNKRLIVTSEELHEKKGYNDYTVEAIDFIKKRDKGFYRIDKNYGCYYKSLNDGLAQNYYGTSAYSPLNQKYYIYFLKALGVIRKGNETDSRWAQGLRGRSIRESVGSVKYYLVKNATNPELIGTYDSIAMFGDVKVFQNNYFLPLGYTYDQMLIRSEFDKLSFDQKDLAILHSFFVNDEEVVMYPGIKKFNLSDTLAIENFTWDYCHKEIDLLKNDTLNVVEREQDFIKGTINLKKKKLLFLSIPFDKGWSAEVDDQPVELKIVDAGMTGIILDRGKHSIELKYQPRFMKIGAIVSVLSILIYTILFWKAKKHSGV